MPLYGAFQSGSDYAFILGHVKIDSNGVNWIPSDKSRVTLVAKRATLLSDLAQYRTQPCFAGKPFLNTVFVWRKNQLFFVSGEWNKRIQVFKKGEKTATGEFPGFMSGSSRDGAFGK